MLNTLTDESVIDELKLSTAVCGIDCFNCELFYTNIDAFLMECPKRGKPVSLLAE